MIQIIILVIFTAIAYALQGTLYTKYARKYNGLSVALVRNIAMIFTGIPLLFLAQDISRGTIVQSLFPIIITACIGAFHVFISYKSYTYIPAGIGQVVKKSTKSLVVLIISLLILHETYTSSQGWGLLLITAGAIRLGTQKIDIKHLVLQNTKLGFGLVFLAGIASACSRYFFSLYNTGLDPYLATYILESSIGIVYILRGCGEYIVKPKNESMFSTIQKIETKDLISMSCITILVLIGTLCSSWALTLGGYGLTSLLSILGVPIAFFLARIILIEKITLTQALAVGVVLIGLWVL